MQSREFKDFIYGEFARVGKTLSSPRRLELLDLLTQGQKSVEALSFETTMSIANTSKHLQALLEAKLVSYTKDKNYVYYRLASEEVTGLIMAIRSTTEDRIAEVNYVRKEHILKNNELESISIDELIKKKENNQVTIIDVRPPDEYESAHIPNSVSVPISQLEDHIHAIPKEKPVIAYCRGPYCVYATEAVELLQGHGYKAAVLDSGINEWKQVNHYTTV